MSVLGDGASDVDKAGCAPAEFARRPRDRFLDDVCPALRDSLLWAIENGGFPHKSRVYFTVLYLTAGWSRCSDAVYSAQIAAIVKIPGDEGERKTRAFLRELAAEGAITWAPQPGRSKRSEVGLRRASLDRPLMAVVQRSENGPYDGQKTTRLAVAKPAASQAATEGVRGVPETGANAPVRDVTSREGGEDIAHRERLQAVFDELLGRPLTRSEHGRRGKAVNELLEVGATDEELRIRVQAFRSLWPDVAVTDMAVCAHWAMLGSKAKRHRAFVAYNFEDDAPHPAASKQPVEKKLGVCFVCEEETEVRLQAGQWFCERHGP